MASVCRMSMVKRTKVVRGVGLFATLGGVDEAVAVVKLGVSVGVDGFLNLEPCGEEEEGWHEGVNVLGVDGDNHRSRVFGYSSSSVLVKVPGHTELDCFRVEDLFSEEEKELVVMVGEDVSRDGVYRQPHSGWRQGEW